MKIDMYREFDLKQEHNPLLTLDEIRKIAVETLLEDRYHQPTVIAVGERDRIIGQVEMLGGNHTERKKSMLLLGLLLSREEQIGKLHEVFFTRIAWLTLDKDSQLTPIQSGQLPTQVEVLIISHRRLYPLKTETIVGLVQRDRYGIPVAVEEIQGQIQDTTLIKTSLSLVDAFISGFQDAVGSRKAYSVR